MKLFSSKALLLPGLAALLLLTGCKAGWETSSDDGEPTPTPEGPGDLEKIFTGPGSSWRLEMDEDDETFELVKTDVPASDDDDESTIQLEATGSYEELSSSFTELTVETVIQGDSVAVGDKIPLMIVGNAVVISAPIETGAEQLQALINADTCPDETYNSNWLLYKQADDFNSDEDVAHHYGRIRVSPTSNYVELSDRYSLDADIELSDFNITTAGCDNGFSESDINRAYLAIGNSNLVELGADSDQFEAGNSANAQFLVGLESYSISAPSVFSLDYIGFYSNSEASGEDAYFPIHASCDAGICTIREMTDLENGNLDQDNAYTLDLSGDLNQPSEGFVIGTLTLPDNETAGKTVCSINVDYADSGDALIACVGTPPGSEDIGQIINIFLMKN